MPAAGNITDFFPVSSLCFDPGLLLASIGLEVHASILTKLLVFSKKAPHELHAFSTWFHAMFNFNGMRSEILQDCTF
jgi:hypothetical protein